MALIKISEDSYVNSVKVSFVEGKKGKTCVWADGKSVTLDISLPEFIRKFGMAEQSNGTQHFAG